MIKRLLPLLIALSMGSVAFAQDTPPATAPATGATETTTTVTTWTTTQPVGALTQDAIETSIANAGYKEVENLKFKDGVWRTKARGGNKQWVKLEVGPMTGRVYPANAPSKLNEDEISAKLAGAGYQNVKHVKFDDGLWSADAKTPHGEDVAVLADPTDGSVVAKSRD
ncbi:PepSY domain-containing protein [Rhodanobacter sp. L36]|uniref:PepSY domain-containing protein n=1 Tax=Rhodanobacter sp. L36 TaxID=1747221 RepID=UPI00131A731D|nr:PepSY domain-containing protein [Rhodanobacter sp. L36]